MITDRRDVHADILHPYMTARARAANAISGPVAVQLYAELPDGTPQPAVGHGTTAEQLHSRAAQWTLMLPYVIAGTVRADDYRDALTLRARQEAS